MSTSNNNAREWQGLGLLQLALDVLRLLPSHAVDEQEVAAEDLIRYRETHAEMNVVVSGLQIARGLACLASVASHQTRAELERLCVGACGGGMGLDGCMGWLHTLTHSLPHLAACMRLVVDSQGLYPVRGRTRDLLATHFPDKRVDGSAGAAGDVLLEEVFEADPFGEAVKRRLEREVSASTDGAVTRVVPWNAVTGGHTQLLLAVASADDFEWRVQTARERRAYFFDGSGPPTLTPTLECTAEVRCAGAEGVRVVELAGTHATESLFLLQPSEEVSFAAFAHALDACRLATLLEATAGQQWRCVQVAVPWLSVAVPVALRPVLAAPALSWWQRAWAGKGGGVPSAPRMFSPYKAQFSEVLFGRACQNEWAVLSLHDFCLHNRFRLRVSVPVEREGVPEVVNVSPQPDPFRLPPLPHASATSTPETPLQLEAGRVSVLAAPDDRRVLVGVFRQGESVPTRPPTPSAQASAPASGRDAWRPPVWVPVGWQPRRVSLEREPDQSDPGCRWRVSVQNDELRMKGGVVMERPFLFVLVSRLDGCRFPHFVGRFTNVEETFKGTNENSTA